MEDLKTQQGANLKRLIKYEKITQQEFADRIGVSLVTVNRWANGQTAISAYNIDQIMKEFPHYSFEFLSGSSKHFTAEDEEWWQSAHEERIKDNQSFALNRLMDYCDCSVERLDERYIDQWESENPGSSYFDWNEDIGFPIYRIANGQKTLDLSAEQWGAFVTETVKYIEMRLNLILDRGFW